MSAIYSKPPARYTPTGRIVEKVCYECGTLKPAYEAGSRWHRYKATNHHYFICAACMKTAKYSGESE